MDYFTYSAPLPPVGSTRTKVAQDLTAPYSQSWVPIAGSYLITAEAIDNLGLISTSTPPATITVNPAFPPFVQLTSPTNGQVFALGAAIPLAADASDQDGTVVSVNFRQYIPDASISTDTSSPYTGSWTNAPVGDSSLIASATDSSGLVTFSSVVTITVTSTNQVYVDAGTANTARLSVYKPYQDAQYAANVGTYNGYANTGNGQALYDMQTIIESTVAMYEATMENQLYNRALLWCETFITKATIFDTRRQENWPGIWASPHSSTNIAYVLEEMQGATSFLRTARTVLADSRLKGIWGTRATAIYNFVRDHVVIKDWYTRENWGAWFVNKYNNPDTDQNDKEIHMARLLNDCKLISSLLLNSDNATYNFPNLATQAGAGLKDYNGREARFTPWTSGSLVWSRGKLFEAPHYIMDTSHAERLAAFVIDFYRSGTVIDQTILTGVCTLFGKVIWTQSTSNPQFNNFIDGSNANFRQYGPYGAGKIYVGWSWFGEFDTNCLAAAQSMLRFINNGGNNPSEDYNNTIWGRYSLSGNLAKCISATVAKPYAQLNGVVAGQGVTNILWTRTSGPGTFTIVRPTNTVTEVLFSTNAVGSHIFKLSVGATSGNVSDTVGVTLLSAPSL